MLADSIGAREIDLSHLAKQVSYLPPPEASLVTKKSHRYLIIGVGASCVVHTLALLVNWRSASIEIEKFEAPVLVIQLQAIPPKPEPVIESSVIEPQAIEPQAIEPKVIEDVAQTLSELPEIKSQSEPISSQSETETSMIQPLSAQELREIIQSNSGEPAAAPTTGIAANVFNPALRKRLQEEELKPNLQRVDAGPKIFTDIHGQSIVDLGGGNCLRSSASKPGEPTNWYMTSCAGKSDSEQIMERVNQAMNSKLKFEE
jgi:hypothetical protein